MRWEAKRDLLASFALCDDECWSTYDHNFWLEQAYKRTDDLAEQEQIINDLLPRTNTTEIYL